MKTPAKITNQDRTRVAYLIRQEFERRLDCLRKARQPTDPDLALAQLRKTRFDSQQKSTGQNRLASQNRKVLPRYVGLA